MHVDAETNHCKTTSPTEVLPDLPLSRPCRRTADPSSREKVPPGEPCTFLRSSYRCDSGDWPVITDHEEAIVRWPICFRNSIPDPNCRSAWTTNRCRWRRRDRQLWASARLQEGWIQHRRHHRPESGAGGAYCQRPRNCESLCHRRRSTTSTGGRDR
jgi:hypothetical protein